MKQKVIIFTGKDISLRGIKKTTKCSYDEKALMEAVLRAFPNNHYEVEIVDYPRCRYFCNIDKIWAKVRMPILIGFGEGAIYINNIKNYRRKYLISPIYNEHLCLFSEPTNIDDYDRDNTHCFFGDNEHSIEIARIFQQHYPNTIAEISEGVLNLIEGVEIVGIYDLMIRNGERDNETPHIS